MLLFVGGAAFAQNGSTPVKVYDENGYFCTGKLRYFIHNNVPTLIVERPDGKGEVAAFYPHRGACVSTSVGSNDRYRYWLTSPGTNSGRVIDYSVVIFAGNNEGGHDLFFKRAPADKSTLSSSKYKYVIPASAEIIGNFVNHAIVRLKVVNPGDIFGDGVHRTF